MLILPLAQQGWIEGRHLCPFLANVRIFTVHVFVSIQVLLPLERITLFLLNQRVLRAPLHFVTSWWGQQWNSVKAFASNMSCHLQFYQAGWCRLSISSNLTNGGVNIQRQGLLCDIITKLHHESQCTHRIRILRSIWAREWTCYHENRTLRESDGVMTLESGYPATLPQPVLALSTVSPFASAQSVLFACNKR